MSALFDATPCHLGEGPLWHPERQELLWFDILGRKLYARAETDAAPRIWSFDEYVSAAGWIDRDHLLIASQSALLRFDLERGSQTILCALEADRAETRSNDGRADPQGGFWIGTMGLRAQRGAGSIYRYFRGELRPLFRALSIPNAIAFAPDGRSATFADTSARKVMRVALDDLGWPSGAPQLYLDLAADEQNPDGAVFDAAGNLWLALWGAGRVDCFDPDGAQIASVEIGARQSSCPAFGGSDLTTLFCTSAREYLDARMLAADPQAGALFAARGVAQGLAEHRVVV